MMIRLVFVMVCSMFISPLCQANKPVGQINLILRGNVVDFTCVVIAGDSNKTVDLGRWPTKQLSTTGDATQPVPFRLTLEGCPPGGAASITFSGKPAPGTSFLALDNAVMAQVAIEIRDGDRTRLPLEQASKQVSIDANGNATLNFFANYIALADGVQPGSAKADATFTINYN